VSEQEGGGSHRGDGQRGDGQRGAEEHFLINPYGLLWSEITASSLVKVRADGGIVDNGSTTMPINPAGFKIHSAVHTSARGREGGDIVWTMHTHTKETVAASNLAGDFPSGLSQFAMDLGPVRFHDFEHATAGDHVCQRLVRDLGDVPCKCLLMRNHGCLVVGPTVSECFFRLYQLIRACEVLVLAPPQIHGKAGSAPSGGATVRESSGGAVISVDEKRVAATFAITENNYTGEPFGALEWRAAVREMERKYGDAYKA